MTVNLEIVGTILGIFTVIGGFFWFVVGRILTDKKDKLTILFEIDKLKEDIKYLKDDIGDINNLVRKIDIIEEKIKHL
ncbi:MAG TPA: hypothetical protein PLZ45_15095 [Ferruginibacter sp.]|nr:hypothetical protein [Ferruginibacter sp.]